MEAISHSSVELALLANVNKDRAVYNTTTMPVNNSSNGPSLPPLNNTVQKNGDKDRKVSNLPKRNPVDLQFKDIEYTVDVGGLFGKRKLIVQLLLLYNYDLWWFAISVILMCNEL